MGESRQVRRARERAEHKARSAHKPDPLPPGLAEKVQTLFDAYMLDGLVTPPPGVLDKIDEFIGLGNLDQDDKTILLLLLLQGAPTFDGGSIALDDHFLESPPAKARLARLTQMNVVTRA